MIRVSEAAAAEIATRARAERRTMVAVVDGLLGLTGEEDLSVETVRAVEGPPVPSATAGRAGLCVCGHPPQSHHNGVWRCLMCKGGCLEFRAAKVG